MNQPDEAPKLSKLPFIAGDILLIATAIGIGLATPAPIGPLPLLAIGLCVIIGSALLVFPFVVNYARRQDALLTERQNQIAALARTTAESAEQIAIATAGLHSLAESSAQNLRSLEKLPLQLQERIDAIAQQISSAKPAAAPIANPAPAASTAKANKEELARLDAASEKIARSLAQLEAAAQTKTDAAESTHKALAELLTRATSQVEALALAAAAASTVAAESTAQLLSERAAAANAAASAASALEALAIRAESIQLPPATLAPAAPLLTTAEDGLGGDNADGNDGVFTPPPAVETVILEDEEPDLDDEALTDDEAALDEAPSAEETEIEEDETEEDLAEEKAPPAIEEPLAPEAAALEKSTAETDTEEASEDEAEDASEADTDTNEADEDVVGETEGAAASTEETSAEESETATNADGETHSEEDDKAETEDDNATEDEAETDDPEIDETDSDEGESASEKDSVVAEESDEYSPAKTSATSATAPDSFEPTEPHSDEVPVDEPAAPKPPRPRKTKPVEDLGFDLGLIPDGQEAAETAVTSDGFTRLVATAYIGIGNKLFIRGSGPGLSWDKGVALQFVSIGKWRWETPDATAPITAKLYKNDQIECTGLGTLTLKPGHQHDVNAGF